MTGNPPQPRPEGERTASNRTRVSLVKILMIRAALLREEGKEAEADKLEARADRLRSLLPKESALNIAD